MTEFYIASYNVQVKLIDFIEYTSIDDSDDMLVKQYLILECL